MNRRVGTLVAFLAVSAWLAFAAAGMGPTRLAAGGADMGLLPAAVFRPPSAAAPGEAPAPSPWGAVSLSTVAVLWRLGGRKEDRFARFSGLGGMDLAGDRILVADAYRGAYLFDFDGGQAGLVSGRALGYVTDVKAGPQGEVYVADAALHQIARFTDLRGEPDLTFGCYGTDPGQFGSHSPLALAVSSDNEIFALDSNVDDAGSPVMRIQVFGAGGEYRRSFMAEPAMDTGGMAIGPDGTLFVVSKQGYVAELEPDAGRLLVRKAQDTLRGTWPQCVALDDAANLYVTTQIPTLAMVIDPRGRLLERIGAEGVRTCEGWPEGEFLFPFGIAVSKDGRRIVVGDTDDTFAYLTAFERLTQPPARLRVPE